MKKIIIFLFILKSLAFGYINIYPLEFEKNIVNGASEEYTLYNRTNKKIKYRIYIENAEDEKSMKEWIEVYPKSITLEPLKEGKIKLYAKSEAGAEEGVYSAKLVIKEIDIPTMENGKKENKHKIKTMVKMKLKGIVEYEK